MHNHPTHFNSQFAGSTCQWSGSDNQVTFEKNLKNNKSKLSELGWLDNTSITYSYNSVGFRDEEFDLRTSGLALGCSQTEGVGVPVSTTWSNKLSELMNVKVWNLGVGGSSADTSFRLLDYWITKLNVKFVTFLVPPSTRFELYTGNKYVSYGPWFNDDIYKIWAHAEENAQVNLRKNLLAMQQICDNQKVPFVFLQFENWAKDNRAPDLSNDVARDLAHIGPKTHQYFAKRMYAMLSNKCAHLVKESV